MQNLGHSAATAQVAVVRLEDGTRTDAMEPVAEETPITLAYNGVPYAVMMASPADLEDFGIGFSVTEGIVPSASAIDRIEVVRYSRGIELQVETSTAITNASSHRRLAGRTGCGICGKDDVEAVLRTLPKVAGDQQFRSGSLNRAMQQLAERQPLNAETGALHAAGWSDVEGTVMLVREDVGRHNALDKLVGALVRTNVDINAGFVVITSRGSFELVQKVAMLGAPLLAAVSAPTALAVRVADDAGITLAGFVRSGRATIYSHAERVLT